MHWPEAHSQLTARHSASQWLQPQRQVGLQRGAASSAERGPTARPPAYPLPAHCPRPAAHTESASALHRLAQLEDVVGDAGRHEMHLVHELTCLGGGVGMGGNV